LLFPPRRLQLIDDNNHHYWILEDFPVMKRQLIIILLILEGVSLLLFPLLADAGNLLRNSGLEPRFIKFGEWQVIIPGSPVVTFTEEVAHDWEKFIILPNKAEDLGDLHFFRASAPKLPVFEHRDGDDAQLFWSKKVFDAGLYQQVSGVTPGEYYGFQAGILHLYSDTKTDGSRDGKMFRSVGIDPTGGTDPTSPNVIWGLEEGLNADWFYPGVGAQAISSTITVFVRDRSTKAALTSEENSVWVDDTFMDVAPTTTMNLSANSATQIKASWSGSPRSGFHLWAYEAQYRIVIDSKWTDRKLFTVEIIPAKPPAAPSPWSRGGICRPRPHLARAGRRRLARGAGAVGGAAHQHRRDSHRGGGR
jgi:hypothetical protein